MPKNPISICAVAIAAALLALSCGPPEKIDLEGKAKQDQEKGQEKNIRIERSSSLSEADQSQVVAKIDEELITLGEYERRLNAQAPFARARYNSLERKKDFLNNMVQFEVLAAEARKKGLDKDPEVILEMKQAMVRRLMADEIDKRMSKVEITEEELKAYYEAHLKDYVRPAKVRASQIVVPDEAAVTKLKKELAEEFLKDPRHKRRIFALKARDVSTDKPTADLGGDMRFFATPENGGLVPKPISDAVFALEHVGDMTEPIKTEKGLHILMLTAKKAKYERTFEEVKTNIKNRLYRERRTTVELDYVKEVKARLKLEINTDLLSRIKDPEPPKGQPEGHGHGATIKGVGGEGKP